MNGYSQAPFNVLDSLHDNYVFISKDQIAKYGISSIKEFYRGENYPDDTSNYFVEFKFKQGRLCQEISFDELKSNIKQAVELAYVCHYKKDKSGKFILSNRTGDAYNGYSHVDHEVTYKYAYGKLQSQLYRIGTLNGYNLTTLSPSHITIDYSERVSYFYNKKGQLDHSKRVSSISEFSNYIFNHKYYIYNNNVLIGYVPSEIKESENGTKVAFSFNEINIQELKKIGFENFGKKYFTKEILEQLIDNCYTPVKNKALLINGKPIKEFLSQIGKSDKKYIVFEIADNSFLFYKITD